MDKHKTSYDRSQSNVNPLGKANSISKLLFWWLTPLLHVGYKRQLEVSDMYEVLERDSSKHLSMQLDREWSRELDKLKEGRKPSLFHAMRRVIGRQMLEIGFIAFIEEILRIMQPLMLGRLILYFSADSPMPALHAYLYVLCLSGAAFLIAFTHHAYFYGMQQIGMRLRVASCSLLYRKLLRLSNTAMSQTTTGQIVNLMSNDVSRFDLVVLFLNYLWIGPLETAAVLAILWYLVGASGLAGFTIIVLLLPTQALMGRLFARFRSRIAALTDERVRLMNEVVSSIRVVKMYCWEKLFTQLIKEARRREIHEIFPAGYVKGVITAIFCCAAKLMVYATCITYCLFFEMLPPSRIFVIIGLFDVARLTLNLFMPLAFQFGSEACISIRRIEEFLLLEEMDESQRPCSAICDKSDCKLKATKLCATWSQELNTLALDGVSLEVAAGELLAVIGPVGGGKSSLLMALLGELPLLSGSVSISGQVAYTSQEAWVFTGTIRDNILFGHSYQADRYRVALQASALHKDISEMPDGDQTLVGERGVSLSGGQKARVNLARALYFNADIYLLDDPLSAVDAAVGRHIFDKCICGVLRNKPRILVTHQLQYLKAADRILILKEGRLVGQGSYTQLAESGVDFSSLLPSQSDSLTDAMTASVVNIEQLLEECEGSEKSNTRRHQSQSLDRDSAAVVSRDYQQPFDTEEMEALLSSSVGHYDKSSHQNGSARGRLDAGLSSGQLLAVRGSVEMMTTQCSSAVSLASLNFINPTGQPLQGKEETRSKGGVNLTVYRKYFHAGMGICGFLLFLLLNIAAQVAYIFSDGWIAYWSYQVEVKHSTAPVYLAVQNTTTTITAPLPSVSFTHNAVIYSAIICCLLFFSVMRAVMSIHVFISAARNLHDQMFHSIVRSPLHFFDTNPVGRILNRFSKDMGQLDELLPFTMYDFIVCAISVIGIVLVAGVINPWVFLPTSPLIVIFFFYRHFYLRTSREVKRLEATTRSPVFTHVSSSVYGLQTIRSYGVQRTFMCTFDSLQDMHTRAWFLFISGSQWLGVRLDLLCAVFVCAVATCSVLAAQSLNGGLVGMTLTYAIGLTGLFQWSVRQSAEVEDLMTSAERILEYTELTPEAMLTTDCQITADWPQYGVITGVDVSLRYSDDGPFILKNLSFCFRAQEKVGIVGRTGAGKSSLIAMLFRLAEPTGQLMIDGIDILTVGLHQLRDKLAIIPQDPVLFAGTLRKNLDASSHHSDEELWSALEAVQMKQAVLDLPAQLDTEICEGGSNFSVGQRQLVCLARALLRKNRILIMDEATANVDPRTDQLIQKTIEERFSECTVLTIAHRLHTVINADRIMVLDDGRIVQFDEPYRMLQDETGIFYNLVRQTGEQEANELERQAYRAHLRRCPADDDEDVGDAMLRAMKASNGYSLPYADE